MNTAKIYRDLNGVERTIHQMVKYEPEWAANRIQAGEDALNSLQLLKAEISRILSAFYVANRDMCCSPKSVPGNVESLLAKLEKLSAVK